MRTATDQTRRGVMWFAVFLLLATVMFTAVAASGRIDTPEEFVMSLRGDRGNAVPVAVAVFLVILTLRRPAVLRRISLAVAIGVACWFLVWQWLVQCDYGQIRHRGGDPKQMLRDAKIYAA